METRVYKRNASSKEPAASIVTPNGPTMPSLPRLNTLRGLRVFYAFALYTGLV